MPSAHLRMAVEFYGRRISALRLVHADDRGNWPWDSWYVRGGQPTPWHPGASGAP